MAATEYVLFRLVKKEASITFSSCLFTFSPSPMDDDDDDDEAEEEKQPEKKESGEILEFVCRVKEPKQIAAAVRKAPHHKFVLFKGEISEVKIHMPVFVGGKNLDTLKAEWE